MVPPPTPPSTHCGWIRRCLNYLCCELQLLQVVITGGMRIGGKESGGGGVEGRIEQWGESMVSMRCS